MKTLLFAFTALLTPLHADDTFIVENGEPRAEIILPETPTGMQSVAAHEFRANIEKITGVRLPILIKPTASAIQIFIGESSHNPIKADGLKDGAYRIASGDNWLALVGDDSPFVHRKPWARNNGDIPRALAKWQKIVGAPYGMPNAGSYKNRLRLPGDTGKPDGAPTANKELLEVSGLDERGSFNAVTAFFRNLGARWYLPGELGEVMPKMKSVSLPKIDEEVHPDFPLRQFNFRFSTAGLETSMWAMRLGTRNDGHLQIAHGLSRMTNNETAFAEHPEWFAIYGGKRDFKPGDSKCQLCYTDEGLFEETVRYSRVLLDTYQAKSVSIMPPDGYTAICQCDDCKGLDSPDRHERGLLSDHVWDFVNRVAVELAKTHPEAKVLNCAYGVYTLPPLRIDKLEPNVQVCIVGGRRPINKAGAKHTGEAAPEALRSAWVEKTDNPLLIFENYPFTSRGWYLPSFAPLALGNTVNATKGISDGEDIWVSAGRDFHQKDIGFNHFMVYFTARMYWGGKDADVEAMFREYCRLFYGPAEQEMHAFFTYCEQNSSAMSGDKAKADHALDLFAAARKKAGTESPYDQRLALIDDYLEGLRMKSQQLGKKRGPVPTLRIVWDAEDIVIDGNLDESYWQKCPTAATGRLRELQTGRYPVLATSFKAGWQKNNLYFAIRCEELPGDKPLDAATRDDDQALFQGDAIEILLETETNSYYQIAISPSGAIVDLDRGASKSQRLRWDSKAEVATQIHDDHWIIEIRIPISQDENDPFHQVIGRQPILSLPWHINICRQRIRENGTELSALSPTGTKGFHEPMKFAHFYDGKSHRFEADPTITDYLTASKAATQLTTEKKYAEAIVAFLALANGDDVTDFQKSASLEQAASVARRLRDYDQAEELAAQIPIEAVKKTSRMHNLLFQRLHADLLEQFGDEDLTQWPFWAAGAGHFARGRAYAALGDNEKAEADFNTALPLTPDKRLHADLIKALEKLK